MDKSTSYNKEYDNNLNKNATKLNLNDDTIDVLENVDVSDSSSSKKINIHNISPDKNGTYNLLHTKL